MPTARYSGVSKPRVLLAGVFGPYGVDDAFGRKENVMELFHNQVTKGQGFASFRFHHRSFGLYFLAANIDADVTVLDFPSRRRFEREVARGYDIVGISFIAPNFKKAKAMAAAVRRLTPKATIVLGGHGAAIDGVESLIECDHVVKGEGIRWMRSFLGQLPDAPIAHPVLPTNEYQAIYGVPVTDQPASLLVPGVGCVNGCKFCSTSHFFGKKYTAFCGSGRALYETACGIADASGSEAFFIMDENFLKEKRRADGFLAEMERNGRYFELSIFSSAEAISAFGVDRLVRLGVKFVWLGVESGTQSAAYEKNKGIDPKRLVSELRDRGISVLASGILCAEHHTKQNIGEEIDFMVDLKADFVQFMLLMPLPTTALYQQFEAQGLLRHELPLEEWHGQKKLPWHHPAFRPGEPEQYLDAAFRKDFEVNSSSMYRVIDTAARGVRHLRRVAGDDPCLAARRAQLEQRLSQWALMLPTIASNGVNKIERARARALEAEVRTLLGPPTAKQTWSARAIRAFTAMWQARIALRGDRVQPKTILTHGRDIAVVAVPIARLDGHISHPRDTTHQSLEPSAPPRSSAISAS